VPVRPATEADIAKIAPALAEAFSGDPPMMWFTPEEEGRAERLVPYFEALVGKLHLVHGEVWVSEDPVGAAAWVAPGKWPFSTWQRRGVIGTELRTFGRHPVRTLRGVEAIERGHPKQPHWYLEYIGVERAGHGKGTGSALLAAMLERCDAENSAAYLNAGSPRSRDLYARHGFEVTERFELPDGGPPLWRMWREPQT
jgi:GNAT superfamily N-acetyltransferase